jgi:hypothetical protein
MRAFDGAHLKIHRATEHITELNIFIQKNPPFEYILETDVYAKRRAIGPKKHETRVRSVALMIGDVVHNIRSSLDHAYWEIVSPHASGEREPMAIQFPFSKTQAGLKGAVHNRLAHRVSPEFADTISNLKPYEESGGNDLLCLIHRLGILDRHKLLTPVADYRRLNDDILRSQIPDMPPAIKFVGVGMSNIQYDILWDASHTAVLYYSAQPGLSPTGKFEQKLKVPVDIIFDVGVVPNFAPVIHTLHQIIDVARTAVAAMVVF